MLTCAPCRAPHHLQANCIHHGGTDSAPVARIGEEYSHNIVCVALVVIASYPSVLAKPFLSVLPHAVLPLT